MKCICTFAQRLAGDGCQACNPEKALEVLDDCVKALTQERDRLRAALAEVRRVLQEADDTGDNGFGCSRDTIWQRPGTTLFDYIDDYLNREY